MREYPPIIALVGFGEVGKSEVAKYLRAAHYYKGAHVNMPMVEMAMPLLRRMGVPQDEILERLTGNRKNDPLPAPFQRLSGRNLLQAIGKDFRDALGDPKYVYDVASERISDIYERHGCGRLQDPMPSISPSLSMLINAEIAMASPVADERFFLQLWLADHAGIDRLINESIRYHFEPRVLKEHNPDTFVIKIEVPGRLPLSDHPSETNAATIPADYTIINTMDGLPKLHASIDDALCYWTQNHE